MRALIASALLLAAAACGGSEKCLTMMLGSGQVSVARGATVPLAVTFSDSQGYVDSVTLVSPPAGLTAVFDDGGAGPTTIVTSGTLRLSASASTTEGTYTIEVEARQYLGDSPCISNVQLTVTVM